MADTDFNVEAFLEKENLSVEDLSKLKKAHLRAIVEHANVTVPTSATKAGLIQAISVHLDLGERQVEPAQSSFELEKLRLELEFKEKEREEREFKLKMAEIEKEVELKSWKSVLPVLRTLCHHPPVPVQVLIWQRTSG